MGISSMDRCHAKVTFVVQWIFWDNSKWLTCRWCLFIHGQTSAVFLNWILLSMQNSVSNFSYALNYVNKFELFKKLYAQLCSPHWLLTYMLRTESHFGLLFSLLHNTGYNVWTLIIHCFPGGGFNTCNNIITLCML